jgi:hypothetical protein
MPSQDIPTSSPAKKGGNWGKSLFGRLFGLFSKRDLIVIATFAVLGAGGAFAATLITVTTPDSQGAGYIAVRSTSCDPDVTINKDITFDLTLNRYVISTISISDVDQRYGVGCGNLVMELALPMNGGVTYASWTIPSSTITNGIFTYGANNSTGITYRAYSTLTPIDVQYSFDKVAIAVSSSNRAVTNGPVYDLLKDNGFTTTSQDASSSNITFALSLSCGTFTVDTSTAAVSAAIASLAAPTGYEVSKWSSSGVDGATSAAYIGFRGTVANINTVLPWISYAWKSDCTTTTPIFQAAIWDAQPAGVTSPIAWNFGENGHYYQYVSPQISWDSAFTAITGLAVSGSTNTLLNNALPSTTRPSGSCNFQLYGMCGYFATVQTSSENAFITSKVGTAGAWLGGNDRLTRSSTRTFRWIDPVAPEYNQVFSTGAGAWNTTPPSYTVNGNTYQYTNWNPTAEPNNYTSRESQGESALQIIAGGTGKWNDFPEDPISVSWAWLYKLGYIVEYGDSTASGEARTGGGSKTGEIVWHY